MLNNLQGHFPFKLGLLSGSLLAFQRYYQYYTSRSPNEEDNPHTNQIRIEPLFQNQLYATTLNITNLGTTYLYGILII